MSTENENKLLHGVSAALRQVLSPSGFPYASNWHLFRDAEFGRDSLEVAEDLIESHPQIACAVLLRLASLQGTQNDPVIEEEPGRIHHEHRARVMEGRPIGEESLEVFCALLSYWYESPDLASIEQFTSYATIDATPLFLRLAGLYVDRYGRALLDELYRVKGSGEQLPFHVSVRRAVDWVVARMKASALGLLEFQRQGPRSIRFQSWKDGATSYVHPDGAFANFEAPIASVEVQALTYDALLAAVKLLPEAAEVDRRSWADLAAGLRETVLERFWMPEEEYFAMALDRHPDTGVVRQVQLLASNPAVLLDSAIFDQLDRAEHARYVGGIARRIVSDEFLTPAGIRCTSLRHRSALDYAAYQSSYTVWHKETYDILKGMRRQGLYRVAEALECRLLNAVNAEGPKEFLYVLPDGRVVHTAGELIPGAVEIVGTNVPENYQAWTISAALAIKRRRGKRNRQDEALVELWAADLDRRLAETMAPTKVFRTGDEVKAERAKLTVGYVNIAHGFERERAFIQRNIA